MNVFLTISSKFLPSYYFELNSIISIPGQTRLRYIRFFSQLEIFYYATNHTESNYEIFQFKILLVCLKIQYDDEFEKVSNGINFFCRVEMLFSVRINLI